MAVLSQRGSPHAYCASATAPNPPYCASAAAAAAACGVVILERITGLLGADLNVFLMGLSWWRAEYVRHGIGHPEGLETAQTPPTGRWYPVFIAVILFAAAVIPPLSPPSSSPSPTPLPLPPSIYNLFIRTSSFPCCPRAKKKWWMKNNRRTFFMSKINRYFAIYSCNKSEMFFYHHLYPTKDRRPVQSLHMTNLWEKKKKKRTVCKQRHKLIVTSKTHLTFSFHSNQYFLALIFQWLLATFPQPPSKLVRESLDFQGPCHYQTDILLPYYFSTWQPSPLVQIFLLSSARSCLFTGLVLLLWIVLRTLPCP